MAKVLLQQRRKATSGKLGDDNTNYFYSIIKHRRLQQAITQLKNKHGESQHGTTTIANILVEFYQELLGQKGHSRTRAFRSFLLNGTILTLEQQLQLVQPYNEKNVKTSMLSIDKNKSPGPYEYVSEFFRSAWKIIGADINTSLELF